MLSYCPRRAESCFHAMLIEVAKSPAQWATPSGVVLITSGMPLYDRGFRASPHGYSWRATPWFMHVLQPFPPCAPRPMLVSVVVFSGHCFATEGTERAVMLIFSSLSSDEDGRLMVPGWRSKVKRVGRDTTLSLPVLFVTSVTTS